MTGSRIKQPLESQRMYLSRSSVDDFGFYHDLIQSSGATAFLLGDKFEAAVIARHFRFLTLFDRQLIGVGHKRGPADIRRDGFEHYYFQVLRSGRMMSGRIGEERHLVPGDAILFDATQPMRSIVDNADFVTVILARDLVEAAAPDARHLHGRILPKSEMSSLGQTVLSLVRCAPIIPETLADGFVQVMTNMLGQIQGSSKTIYSDTVNENKLELLRRLRAEIFIEDNLAANLNAELVARSVGVSRSSLYRAMHTVGGVEAVITRRRAARLRSLILQSGEKISIRHLVERAGFSSLSHGSQVFKETYGQSPNQLRWNLRTDVRSATHALHSERMRDWYGAMNDGSFEVGLDEYTI